MTTVPYALSIHSFINSVGADAGFAAIIGLAILVLLYFAQARETATLRERLDNASQWIEALEGRLSQLQRGQAPAPGQAQQVQPGAQPVPSPAAAGGVPRRPGQPSPRPAGAPAPGATAATRGVAPGTRIPLSGAPAGMAAPALAAATRLIPVGGASSQPVAQNGEDQQTGVGAPAVAGPAASQAPNAATAAPVGAPAAASGAEERPTSEDTMLVAPAPATAAALANGRSKTTASPAAAPPPRGPTRSGNGPVGAGGGAAALSARRQASRQLPPLRSSSGAPSGPSRARRLIPILVGLGVVVVIVAALLIVTGNNSSSTTVHKTPTVSANSKHGGAAAVDPASVKVAVLNGTSVTNLAHDVSSRLATDGYKQGAIATAANQTNATTTVAYLSGHRTDARAVAAVLNLKTSAVKPVNQQAMGVACPGASSASCSDDVVVTVGNDLSGLSSPQAG